MRGVKKADSPAIKGFQIYHNFIRPHMGLKGRTPAEAAGIKVEGENEWPTIIRTRPRKVQCEGLSEQASKIQAMAGLSRQAANVDVASLSSLLLVLVYFLIFYWFYSILKRMEKTLLEIKQLLEKQTRTTADA